VIVDDLDVARYRARVLHRAMPAEYREAQHRVDPRKGRIMAGHRIFGTPFGAIYPHYVAKAERKGHTAGEVDHVISWLTGYDEEGIARVVADDTDLETFFADAPALNPNASLITGTICGLRVQEIEDPLMQKIRYMDLLVDEVARGKKMTSILRGS
jgi:hypothetical protein